MVIYIYHKCSTCKDAIRFLANHKILVTQKEITAQSPSLAELEAMLTFQGNNLKKLFNTSGELYREMKLSEKLDAMSVQEAFQLLQQHGMLVKRPFMIGQKIGLVGFKEAAWLAQLPNLQ